MAIADNLEGIAFSSAMLAIRIHRRRKETGKKESRRSDYAVTSLDVHQTTPAELAAFVRGQWGIENSSHYIQDVTFGEDASTVHSGAAPRAGSVSLRWSQSPHQTTPRRFTLPRNQNR
ncbi:transposase [Glycomyces buryatensis]|uniref:transposase n=1 Tax=Glycomyces buryatensis TaxID=2570927 RepID=UPI001B3C1486|nr:transposase [Glycomyces buryatensis]